jgi:hypothetical protein
MELPVADRYASFKLRAERPVDNILMEVRGRLCGRLYGRNAILCGALPYLKRFAVQRTGGVQTAGAAICSVAYFA